MKEKEMGLVEFIIILVFMVTMICFITTRIKGCTDNKNQIAETYNQAITTSIEQPKQEKVSELENMVKIEGVIRDVRFIPLIEKGEIYCFIQVYFENDKTVLLSLTETKTILEINKYTVFTCKTTGDKLYSVNDIKIYDNPAEAEKE